MAIGVIATLKVQDGKQAEFEAVFRDLASKVRAGEPGNRLYQLCRSKADATTYVVMEIYETEEALKTHGQTEYFKAAGAKMAPALAGRPDIAFYETV
jgi:quinol monooxygenase YgiN